MMEAMTMMPNAMMRVLLASMFPEQARVAMEAERTREHGYCLGLTEEEVRETVREWSDIYRTRPDPLPWDRVRAALTKRVMDKAGVPERSEKPPASEETGGLPSW